MTRINDNISTNKAKLFVALIYSLVAIALSNFYAWRIFGRRKVDLDDLKEKLIETTL